MKMLTLCSTLISTILMALLVNLMEKKYKNKEKKSPFECGFNTVLNKKMMFSTNFIMLTMMFLIFDVEIFILIPFILTNKNHEKNLFKMTFTFMLILTLLMLKEWKQGSLEWNK